MKHLDDLEAYKLVRAGIINCLGHERLWVAEIEPPELHFAASAQDFHVFVIGLQDSQGERRLSVQFTGMRPELLGALRPSELRRLHTADAQLFDRIVIALGRSREFIYPLLLEAALNS